MGVIGIKKFIGVAALAAAAMIASGAAEASTLSFNLQSADYNYSWTMDSDPTVAHLVPGFETTTTEFTGQAIGTSTALPAGEIFFYSSLFGGALGFQDSLGNSLFDFSGDTIYTNGEAAPHFSAGVFAITFDNHSIPAGAYAGTLTVATVAATPIPAALPLFASALGGIGFVGWRRRKNAAAA